MFILLCFVRLQCLTVHFIEFFTERLFLAPTLSSKVGPYLEALLRESVYKDSVYPLIQFLQLILDPSSSSLPLSLSLSLRCFQLVSKSLVSLQTLHRLSTVSTPHALCSLAVMSECSN